MLFIFAVIIQLLCFGHLYTFFVLFWKILLGILKNIPYANVLYRLELYVLYDLLIVLILKHMGNVVGTKWVDRLVRKDFQIEMNYDHHTCLRKVELFRWK